MFGRVTTGGMRRRRRALLAACVGLALAGCGGAAVSATCRARISDCLKRCEAATPDTGEPAKSAGAYSTQSECEIRCGCSASDPPKKPIGKVTPTS